MKFLRKLLSNLNASLIFKSTKFAKKCYPNPPKMKRFYYFLSLLLIVCFSCKVTYNSIPFDENNVADPPNYKDSSYWAVLPDKIPTQLIPFYKSESKDTQADVFFVYPTLLTDKKDTAWNADTNDTIFNQKILDKSVHYQASAWANAGRLFVPYYRQSHYRIYVEPYMSQSGNSYEIAYSDVKRAFEYYLEHYNNGRPIIIAAHSQGSAHCKRLLQEYFDGKPLQNKLIAAYLPGIRIKADEFKVLKPMLLPDEIGGYVSWNSYKRKRMPKKYDSWFKGAVTSNPISWNSQKNSNKQQHKGLLYNDDRIYPQSLAIEVKDGILWVSVPKVPKRFLMRFIKNYHFADINLFWEDIRLNVQERIQAYFNRIE